MGLIPVQGRGENPTLNLSIEVTKMENILRVEVALMWGVKPEQVPQEFLYLIGEGAIAEALFKRYEDRYLKYQYDLEEAAQAHEQIAA